ncbi:MAG: HEAT repeat domain-containing protein [Acidobacteria bacterium]|nr:HEAT repeat domain-containing protein [Acidobacteriota bacterium]
MVIQSGTRRTLSVWGCWLLAISMLLAVVARADEPFARNRVYDLQHVRIEMSFDIAQRKIMGKVTHTLTPLHGDLSEVEFDSVDLTIQKVSVGGQPAKFASANDKLKIELPKPARPGESLNISIQYEGQPKRGLFFILPDKNYPHRPIQIWTQGESEDTRYYIPIYDYPNDLVTTETILTVPESWKAVSNGKLLGVKPAAGGMKTWEWKSAKPFATYLIAIAAGEMAERTETWRGIPVTFYAPKDRENLLEPTYRRTRAMLDFYSEKLGVLYPWEKYGQATVDEFVAEGMENASLTINATRDMEHPEMDAESRYHADWLVSHELAHQWFGDLVTAKDWGHVWLNEAFASYMDTLWREHSLGKDDVAYYVWNEGRQWMQGQSNYVTPIVTHDFTDFVMLSGNFYQKGDQVVYMLRGKLGDENFFKALQYYLKKYAHQNVVTADLARAIEESTGANVDSFLEQWVFCAGAPRFQVSYTWDEYAKQIKLSVKQTQKVENYVHLFRLPVPVEITTDTGSKRHTIWVTKASEDFTLPAETRPRMVVFDAGNTLLDATQFQKEPGEWIYQLQHGNTVPDRAEAARVLREVKDKSDVIDALGTAAMNDPFWGVRVQAMQSLGAFGGPAAQKYVLAATANSESWVRSDATTQLAKFTGDDAVAAKVEAIYREDKAFTVRAAALRTLGQLKSKSALEVLRAASKVDSPGEIIRAAAISGMGSLADPAAVPTLMEWAAPGKPLLVRQNAVTGLGRVDKKNKEITHLLASFLKEPYFQLRLSTAFALGARGDEDAIPALEEFAKSGAFPLSIFEQFVRGQIQAIRAANKPADPKPASSGSGAGSTPPPLQ